MLAQPSPDQVRALAPDPSAARAGEGLGSRRHWSGTGRNEAAVWGLCQGSGANPYQVTVDVHGPAFKCTCPSRKFPCKHSLGLLFLVATDPASVPETAQPPAWATEWLQTRTQRADAAAARTEARAARTPEDDAEADAGRDRRALAREKKVDGGIADLDRFLRDIARRGLVAAKGEGYAFWDEAGARLVDAQAASLGREVRGLGAATNRGSAWAEGSLERIGRLHLIVEAYRRRERLPPDLQADVRSLVGWSLKEDDLPHDSDVTDRWLVLARSVSGDERLTTARTWFVGASSGRFALHLAFGAGGAKPAPVAMPGASFQGTLRFYPSAAPVRGVVLDGSREPGAPVNALSGGAVRAAAAAFADVLARSPFVGSWPTILADVVPVVRDGALLLRDAEGDAVRIRPPSIAARLVALAGGRPITVFGAWTGQSIHVLSAVADGMLTELSTDAEADEVDEPVPARGGDNDPWGQVVTAALLGTERSDPPALALGGPVDRLAGRSVEERLLSTAALVAPMRRAGWQPEADSGPAPVPAADDPRPAVDAGQAYVLRRALDSGAGFVAEWLGLARLVGRRPPDDELPRLLALAGRNEEIGAALRPLLGPRAAWLVEQMPELADGLAGQPAPDPAAAWDAARSPAARSAVVAAARRADPVAGRTLVEDVWDDATVAERVAAIEALETGLGPADEPLLERALADGRAEVRATAVDALARLPASAFTVQAETVARPLLASVGRFRPSLEARLPEWSDDLARLALVKKPPSGVGERTWWLRQLVGRVAPSRWEAWLDSDPKGLVDRALRSEETAGLVMGWLDGTRRFRDGRWALALWSTAELAKLEAYTRSVAPVELLLLMPDGVRGAAAARQIDAEDEAPGVAIIAEALPAPWPDAVEVAVRRALVRTATSSWLGAGVAGLAGLAARRVAPSALDPLETVIEELGRRSNPAALADAFDTIRFRQQLQSAFTRR